MAYISQYEIDMQQDQRNRQNQGAIGDAIVGAIKSFGENRKRALELKRANQAQDFTLASSGASADDIKQFRETGDASNIMNKYAAIAEAKRLKDLADADSNKEKKTSEVNKNNAIADYYKRKGTTPSVPKMSDKEKIDYRNKLEQENKQPAQNEFAAAGFSKRARQAEDDLSRLPEDIGTSWKDGVQEWLPNSWNTDNHQLFDQAKRNFITANLRKESGAAIGKEEYESEEKKYFPQVGDSPAVLAQKKQAREQAMLNLEAEGSRALSRMNHNQPRFQNVSQKIQQYTPEQKAQRLQQLRAKKAGVATVGQ